MVDYPMSLGTVVKEARKSLGLTQMEVANQINVDVRTILNIENHRGNPKMEVLYPLIRTLHIDPTAVFYPERQIETPALRKVQMLIGDCNEAEAKVIYSTVAAVLDVLRAKENEKTEIE